MMRPSRPAWCVLAALLLARTPAASAQSLSAAAVEGVVRNTAGIPLEDAVVTLSSAGGRTRELVTLPGGRFGVPLLAPGTYALLVERVGHAPHRVTGIALRAGAVTHVDVALTAAAAADPPVEESAFRGTGAEYGPPHRLLLDGPSLRALPAEHRDAGTLAGLAALLAGGSASGAGLLVDGTPRSALALPGGLADPLAGGAFPWSALEGAELVAPMDVEWGAAPAGVALRTRRGTASLSAEGFGSWARASLAAGDGFGPGSVDHDGMEGGIVVTGPGFAAGGELRRFDTPLQLGPRAEDLLAALATAGEAHGVALRGGTELVRTDRASAFAAGEWEAGAHSLRVDAFAAALLTPERRAGTLLAAGGGSAEGRDVFASAVVASAWSPSLHGETRVWMEHGSRDFSGDGAEGAGGMIAPSTRVVDGALAFGVDPAFPGRFSRTAVHGGTTLYVRYGAHTLKAGATAGAAWHGYDGAAGSLGTYLFGGADDFAAGRGYFAQAVGPGGADFVIPGAAAFLQDSWRPAPALELRAGVRADYHRLPFGGVPPHDGWGMLTGLNRADLPGGALRVSPRASAEWTSGAVRVYAGAGLFAGEPDPRVAARVLGDDGRLRVRRALDVPYGWDALPDTAAAPFRGMDLTLLSPGYAPPRAVRTHGGLSLDLGGWATLHAAAAWTRTDRLPRTAELNRLAAPSGRDQYGRPLYGTLAQRGALLVAEPGSNRRFAEFDRVAAIEVDGVHRETAVTAAVERAPATGLRWMAAYTRSRARDNRSAGPGVDPAEALAPLLDGDAAGWAEGTADRDVPHRVLALAELRLGGRLAPSAGLVYRYRSGLPFTPGFRAGVDVDGDGASGDPAFVDAGVAGMDALLGEWSCLERGRFAARNACRAPGLHALDVRLGVDLFRSARLTLEGLNLAGADAGIPDAALYLVDPARTLEVDAEGRTTVPLVVNPAFGEPLYRRASGRVVRLGLHLRY
jgi:hypothetical protein